MITCKKANAILKKLLQNSQRPPENTALLQQYLYESYRYGGKITFYNWECPPRFLDKTTDGSVFVNYDVNLKKIFNGEKIDKFTELPRVVIKYNQEIKILQMLNLLNIKYRFVKLIADTNAFYITPDTMKICDPQKMISKNREFKRLILQKLKTYPAETSAYLFTELIKKYQGVYDNAYRTAIILLRTNPEKLISAKTFKQQLARTKQHLGLTDIEEVRNFSIRTIASYAAEGIVLEKLSQTKRLSNCVWLNIEEANDRTVAITNCLRTKTGYPNLPMIFPAIQKRRERRRFL